MGARIYGYKYGERNFIPAQPVGASEVVTDTGGKFVKQDGSGRIEVAGSGDAEVFGWAEIGAFTASATEGADQAQVDVSSQSVYYIPADAAVTASDVGKTCDLIVASNVQKADIGESNEDVLLIVDVDVDNQAVYVRLNPTKFGQTGV